MVRQHNWFPEEIRLLIEGLIARRAIIYGRNSPYLTESRKNQAWDDIADIINAANIRRLSKVRRTREQLKTKERYYTSELRTKYRRICDLREQTGLGAAVFDNPRNVLTQNEQLALTLIGETSATGVQDAVRVHHPNLVQNQQAAVPPAAGNVVAPPAAAAGAPPANNGPADVAAPAIVNIQPLAVPQAPVVNVADAVAPPPVQMVAMPKAAYQPVNNVPAQAVPAPQNNVVMPIPGEQQVMNVIAPVDQPPLNMVALPIPPAQPINQVQGRVGLAPVNLGPLPFPKAQPVNTVPAPVAARPANNVGPVVAATQHSQNASVAAPVAPGVSNVGPIFRASAPTQSFAPSVSFANAVVTIPANGMAAGNVNPVPGPSMMPVSSAIPVVDPIMPEIFLEPPVVFLPEGSSDLDEKKVIPNQGEYVSSCRDTAPAAQSNRRTSSLSVGFGSQSSGPSIIPPTQGLRASPDIFDNSHISISSESTCSSIRDLFVKPLKGKGRGTKRKMSCATSCSQQQNSTTTTSGLPSPPQGVKRSRLSLPKTIPMTDTRRDDLLQVQANLYAGLRSLTEQITQLVNLVSVIADYFRQQAANLQRENHRHNQDDEDENDEDDDEDVHNAPTE